MPPTKIDILNHVSGSRIDVKENEEVEIACKVSNAKPKARINWFRNNVAFNPGLGQYIVKTTNTAGILDIIYSQASPASI